MPDFELFDKPTVTFVAIDNAKTQIFVTTKEINSTQQFSYETLQSAQDCSLHYSLDFALEPMRMSSHIRKILNLGLLSNSDSCVPQDKNQSIEDVVTYCIKQIQTQAPKVLLYAVMNDYFLKLKDNFRNFANLFYSRHNKKEVALNDKVYLQIAGLTDSNSHPNELGYLLSSDFPYNEIVLSILLSEKAHSSRSNLGGERIGVRWIIGSFFAPVPTESECVIRHGFRMLKEAHDLKLFCLNEERELSIKESFTLYGLQIEPSDFQKQMTLIKSHLKDEDDPLFFKDIVGIIKNKLEIVLTSEATISGSSMVCN